MTALSQPLASINVGAIAQQWSAETFSPLMLSDQLLTLAQYADRAGLRPFADDLLNLALLACDYQPASRHNPCRNLRRNLRQAGRKVGLAA